MQCADVGLVQRSDGFGFPLRELRRGNLDGNVAAQARIAGAIHLPHPSLAEGTEEFVRPEFFARRKRHTRDSA
jgi:hypothetical protein